MAGESTSDSGSIGPSIQDEIGKDLILETRANSVLYPAADEKNLAGMGVDSFTWNQLTNTNLDMTTITTGTAEADPGTAVVMVVAARKATAVSRALWLLQSWMSERTSKINWASEIPGILGRAAADARDILVGTLAAGHSHTTGATGTDLTYEALRAATVLLERYMKGAARGAIFLLHPHSLGQVARDATAGNGISLSPIAASSEMILNIFGDAAGSGVGLSYKGVAAGCPTFQSTNIPDMNGSTDHANCLIIPKTAWGYVEAWGPELVMDSQTVNLKLAKSAGVSFAGGVVEKQDDAGVTIPSAHA